jgi:hypothetical protein
VELSDLDLNILGRISRRLSTHKGITNQGESKSLSEISTANTIGNCYEKICTNWAPNEYVGEEAVLSKRTVLIQSNALQFHVIL